MDVFIIIVTYNAMQWLPKCLESTKPFPVIIVDNNSQDGTVEFIKSRFPKVVLFEQKKNLGFGQANNIGISYALKNGANYVFLLNQDAYLQSGCLNKLMEVHQRNQDYGILSPIHLNGKGDLVDQNFSYYTDFKANRTFYSDFVLGKPPKEIYEVPFVNAAGWLISKRCIMIVGGFDPIFFHYGEDDNYCQRVRYHGLRIAVVPDSFMRHDRENKVLEMIRPYTRKYLDHKERSYKILYGNINKEEGRAFKKEQKKLIKLIVKNFIFLRFRLVQYYKNEYKMLEKLESKIVMSRATNKIRGIHYLNLI